MFGSRVRRNVAPRGLLWGSALVLALTLTLIVPLAPSGAAAGAVPAGPPAYSVEIAPPSLPPQVVPPQVLASPQVGSGPAMAVLDPGNGYVYVVNSVANTVSVLDGTTVLANVSVSNATYTVGDPTYLVYDPGNGYVYAIDRYSFETEGGAVSVLSGTSLLGVVPLGLLPSGGAYDPADGYVYVTEAGSAKVVALDGTSLTGTVSVGADPGAAVYSPADRSVYVANRGSDSVSVVSGLGVVRAVPVGSDPVAFGYDPALGDVLVANNGSGNVSVLNGTEVVANVATGANPSAFAFDAATSEMYVANRNASDATILSGTSVVGSVPSGVGPDAAAWGSSTGFVYLANAANASVTVVDGSAVVGNVTVGNTPASAVFDPVLGYLYVTNVNSRNVSVLAIAYAVSFNETGLAPGTLWSVGVGSHSRSSTGSSIVFGELPGSHPYAIPVPAGYVLVSSTPGSPVVVPNGPVTVTVTFGHPSSAKYALTFDETGLSSMCGHSSSWSVTVGNVTESSTGASIVFSEPNGTYNYSVAGPSGQSVVSEVPASPVTIAGGPATVQITFGRGGHSSQYSVTFQENGLPRGTTWCVDLTSTVCSASSQIQFTGLSPGTYSFTIAPVNGYTARPASGTVTIYDHSIIVRVQFSGSHGSHHCGGGWAPEA